MRQGAGSEIDQHCPGILCPVSNCCVIPFIRRNKDAGFIPLDAEYGHRRVIGIEVGKKILAVDQKRVAI